MGHAHHARKHYSQEQALTWIIQIAKGLRYLHTSKPKVRCSPSSAGLDAMLAPLARQPRRHHARTQDMVCQGLPHRCFYMRYQHPYLMCKPCLSAAHQCEVLGP